MSSPAVATPGFFGKLPACGDFVSRDLPRSFVAPWDDWLQAALARSRHQLGETWLDCYLRSPLWRFALSAGACGSTAYAGVLMPSVDKVGRYYPLAIAVPLPTEQNLLALLGDPWFEQAEQTALAGLDEQLGLDGFAGRVQTLAAPAPCPAVPWDAPAWHCPGAASDPAALAALVGELAGGLLASRWPAYSLWWGDGSAERIDPCLLLCQNLPAPAQFAALLCGDWEGGGWRTWPAPARGAAAG